MERKRKFAWFPVMAHKLKDDPLGRWWYYDGWIWWEHYEVVKTIYGDTFRKRIETLRQS